MNRRAQLTHSLEVLHKFNIILNLRVCQIMETLKFNLRGGRGSASPVHLMAGRRNMLVLIYTFNHRRSVRKDFTWAHIVHI